MDKIIFTSILIVFPLGQLIKFGALNLFDLLILILAVWTFFQKPKYPKWFSYFLTFILFSLFSWIFNYFIFNNILTFKGLLYLVRLLIYSYVAIYILNCLKNKKSVVRSLLMISLASAILGWLQYFFIPDTRFLKNFGWDDHLYRMVGTFFDPAFLGLILVLGSIIALFKKRYLIFLFLALSIIFTYSRASYLTLFLIFIIDLFKNKNIFKFIILNLIFIILFFVPKNLSEGTDFARTVSATNKLSNFKETFEIIKKSPVLGVGFNNICLAKTNVDINSHSCFGADNSILFILATTGTLGMITLLSAINHMPYDIMLKASFFAVFVHGMFTNSLFYPHVMFWLFSLLGLRSVIKSK